MCLRGAADHCVIGRCCRLLGWAAHTLKEEGEKEKRVGAFKVLETSDPRIAKLERTLYCKLTPHQRLNRVDSEPMQARSGLTPTSAKLQRRPPVSCLVVAVALHLRLHEVRVLGHLPGNELRLRPARPVGHAGVNVRLAEDRV